MPKTVRGILSTRTTNWNQSSCGAGLMPLGTPGISRNSGPKRTKTTCEPNLKITQTYYIGKIH